MNIINPHYICKCVFVFVWAGSEWFPRIGLQVGAGWCARAFGGDCWVMFMNICTHVWVSLFKTDARQSTFILPEIWAQSGGVISKTIRERVSLCSGLCINVCYRVLLSLCHCAGMYLSVGGLWIGSRSQQIGGGFAVSYRLSLPTGFFIGSCSKVRVMQHTALRWKSILHFRNFVTPFSLLLFIQRGVTVAAGWARWFRRPRSPGTLSSSTTGNHEVSPGSAVTWRALFQCKCVGLSHKCNTSITTSIRVSSN